MNAVRHWVRHVRHWPNPVAHVMNSSAYTPVESADPERAPLRCQPAMAICATCATGAPLDKSSGARNEINDLGAHERSEWARKCATGFGRTGCHEGKKIRAAKPLISLCATGFGEISSRNLSQWRTVVNPAKVPTGRSCALKRHSRFPAADARQAREQGTPGPYGTDADRTKEQRP